LVLAGHAAPSFSFALLCAGLLLSTPVQAAGLPQPASLPPSPTAGSDWTHVVEPGDTLIGLQRQLLRPGANWRVIQRLNRVADPYRLQPGKPLRIPAALLRAEPLDAEVLHAHGDVWLERAGAARQPLAAAASLRAGDIVGTGAKSSLTLRFADGSRTQLGPNGQLRLDNHARLGGAGVVRTELRLDAGGTETQVPPQRTTPRFDLRTPAVNLGVRGTQFRARVDEARTLVEVEQGQVAAGRRAVDAGFGAVATTQGTSGPQPLLPAPALAGLPERIERLPLQLAWPTAGNAGRYRAQVLDVSAETPRLVLEAALAQSQVEWPDELPDGRYELRVRAADAQGLEGRSASHVFTLDTQPVPPFPLRPRADERLEAESTTLAWARNPQAARYRLQIASEPGFAQPVLTRDDLTATELAAALPLGMWHWRVGSITADGDIGPWGDVRRFERVHPPPPPPAPTAEVPRKTDTGIVVGWSASTLPGASYQVQIARDAAFTDLLVDERVTRTEQLLPAPAPGTYHVRVRTIGADGRAGAFGAPQLVEVPRSLWWLWLLPLLLLL
jgi:hypothetical protein